MKTLIGRLIAGLINKKPRAVEKHNKLRQEAMARAPKNDVLRKQLKQSLSECVAMMGKNLNPQDFDELDWFEDNFGQIENNPFDTFQIAAGIQRLTINSGLGEHPGCSDYEGMRETYR